MKCKCKECKKNVLAVEKSPVNHFASIFMCFLTLGFWILPYLYIAATAKPKLLCPSCGSEVIPIKNDKDSPNEEIIPLSQKLFTWTGITGLFVYFIYLITLFEVEKTISGLELWLYFYLVLAIYKILKHALQNHLNTLPKHSITSNTFSVALNWLIFGLTALSLYCLYQSTSILNFWIIAIPFSFNVIAILGMFLSADDVSDVGNFFMGPIIAVTGVIVLIFAKYLGYVEVELSIAQSVFIGLIPWIAIFVQELIREFIPNKKS